MLSGCLGFFPFKFWVYSWEVTGWRGGFFFQMYVVWRVDYLEWTLDFPCKFYWGRPGAGGEDLFSFQPIGGPKLGGDREDYFFQFSLFPNVFPQCSF
jgi:hypothetical protein